jgi:hypothetical protein
MEPTVTQISLRAAMQTITSEIMDVSQSTYLYETNDFANGRPVAQSRWLSCQEKTVKLYGEVALHGLYRTS